MSNIAHQNICEVSSSLPGTMTAADVFETLSVSSTFVYFSNFFFLILLARYLCNTHLIFKAFTCSGFPFEFI